jgi:hypothetical protein
MTTIYYIMTIACLKFFFLFGFGIMSMFVHTPHLFCIQNKDMCHTEEWRDGDEISPTLPILSLTPTECSSIEPEMKGILSET